MLPVTDTLAEVLPTLQTHAQAWSRRATLGGAMRKHSPSGATAQSAIPELTLMDTCDQCGAAACVRVAVTDGQHLDFCGHHYDEHAVTLLAAGYRVLDRRGLACRD